MILIDAGPLIALCNRRDPDHALCVATLASLPQPLLTTWTAFGEAMHLIGEMGKRAGLGAWAPQAGLGGLVDSGALAVAEPTVHTMGRMRALRTFTVRDGEPPVERAEGGQLVSEWLNRLGPCLERDRLTSRPRLNPLSDMLQCPECRGHGEIGRRSIDVHNHGMPRRSSFSTDDLRRVVASSFSFAQVLSRLGLKPAGGNYRCLKDRLQRDFIDFSHFKHAAWSRGVVLGPKRELDDYLGYPPRVKSSTYELKGRLLKEGLMEARCCSCHQESWLGSPIPLELDHINGVSDDNRLSNLRLLCPNCHALTPTYRAKNRKF